MCQPLSSRNKKGNVPGQRVGGISAADQWEPDPREALCVPAVSPIVLCLPPQYPLTMFLTAAGIPP